MQNEEKMRELIAKLKERKNNSYKFFEELLVQFMDAKESEAAREKLVSSMAISQYAGFTYEEERLLGEIIEANLKN
jgi:hypothetical protein